MSKHAIKAKGPCPTFFRCLCRTASDGRTGGYQWAGYGLISHVAGTQLMPDDVESDEEWFARIEALDASIEAHDDDAVLRWLDANLPRCMALVPGPRRSAFLKGIYRYVIEEENELVS